MDAFFGWRNVKFTEKKSLALNRGSVASQKQPFVAPHTELTQMQLANFFEASSPKTRQTKGSKRIKGIQRGNNCQ